MSRRSRSDEDYPEVPTRMIETPSGLLLVPGDDPTVLATALTPALPRTKTDPYPPDTLERLLARELMIKRIYRR